MFQNPRYNVAKYNRRSDSVKLRLIWGGLLFIVILIWLVQTESIDYVISSLLLGVLAFFLSVLVHELGHTVAGFLVGFHFDVFAVGPFMLFQKEQKIRFGWNRGRFPFVGYTIFLPPNHTNLRNKLVIYLIAGPLASLLLVLVAVAISAVYPFHGNTDVPLFLGFIVIQMIGWMSTFFLLMSLIPSPQLSTDGAKLVKLFSNSANSDRWIAIFLTSLAILKGQRPRDWDVTWIERLTALKDASADAVTANRFAYHWALDTSNIVRAREFLVRMIESRHKTTLPMRATILVEAAFFELRYRHDATQAAKWLKQVGDKQKLAPPVTQLRLEAADALLDNKLDEVREIANKALATLSRSQDGVSLGEVQLFEDILAQCSPTVVAS